MYNNNMALRLIWRWQLLSNIMRFLPFPSAIFTIHHNSGQQDEEVKEEEKEKEKKST